MAETKWTFKFRDDQCAFIVSAMEYIMARADERIDKTLEAPFVVFAAQRTKERAAEIREMIAGTTG